MPLEQHRDALCDLARDAAAELDRDVNVGDDRSQ
jgi:hypothetical protein